MTLSHTTMERHGLFRGTILTFAFVLACQAVWILAAEFYHRPSTGFPIDAQTDATAVANRHNAALAASIGIIRGDLWANYALTYPDLFRYNEESSKPDGRMSETIDGARRAIERALAYAPYDARIWLGLANSDSRFDWLNGQASSALRMSYYTGTNEIDLIPLRLSLAVSLSVISDTDFQQFVRRDIRIAVTHKPKLEAAVLDAYRNALPVAQQFIEETLKEMDPTLLSKLQSK